MNKTVTIVVAVVLVLVAFLGGAFLGPKLPLISSLTGTSASAGGRGFGGPMANLSADERAKIQNMSDTERQQYFQSKFGGQMPGGQSGQNGTAGGFRGPRTMTIDGTVMDISTDSMTVKTAAGGSQTVYYDGKTTIAYAKGVTASSLAKDMKVLVIAQPETDQVISATAVLVK